MAADILIHIMEKHISIRQIVLLSWIKHFLCMTEIILL